MGSLFLLEWRGKDQPKEWRRLAEFLISSLGASPAQLLPIFLSSSFLDYPASFILHPPS